MDRQINAYINEAKGNLFEFLVGHNIYLKSPDRKEFSQTLPHDYSLYLSKLEEILINYDRELMEKLPFLAEKIVKYLERHLQLDQVEAVKLCGKHNVKKNQGEQDLELTFSNIEPLLVSLKLLKSSSSINTKSAGILTFFEKYFNYYGEERNFQAELNKEVKNSFFCLRDELYQLEKIPRKDQFISWKKLGHPTLPGQLNLQQKEFLFAHYNRISIAMFETLVAFQDLDKDQFYLSLIKLAGLDNPDITQLHCYHDNHNFSHGILMDQERFKKFFVDYSMEFNQKSLISFKTKHIEMQIRIKPMNIFTDLSYKVNCSLKIDPNLSDF